MSAASWGGSDFIGGLGARRAPALLLVVSGHFVTLLILLAICLGAHLPIPARHDFLFAAIGGFEGALALALFYRALAMGTMGLTAALTGLLTALVPVLFSLMHDGLPTLQTGAGLAIGLAALWLITHTPVPTTPPSRSARSTVPHPLRALCGKGGKPQTPLIAAQEEYTEPKGEAKSSPTTALLLGALAG